MEKHAYCIIAHNEPEILKMLVEAVDDVRNDIFILLDKKSDMRVFKDIKAVSSNLYWTKRINIYWGHWSQIRAELLLLESAYTKGREESYSYYHLVSGTDYPLNLQDYIHNVCDSSRCEFVGFESLNDDVKALIRHRTSYYHFFVRYIRNRNRRIRKAAQSLHDKIISIQEKLHIRRRYPLAWENDREHGNGCEHAPVLQYGCNWCSITDKFVSYLLKSKKLLLKQFRWTLAADEIFIQSVLWNSPFRKRIYARTSGNDYLMCMREVDWSRGNPYVWKTEDAPYLLQSDRFFARKFSSSDPGILNILRDKLDSK